MKKLLSLLFGLSAGYVAGIFFAQKSGKELRKELKKSKTPLEDLFNELKKADKEFLDFSKEKLNKYFNDKK